MTHQNFRPMNVAVIGAGYVGLVSAAGFASHGHDVTVIDTDLTRVEAVNTARPHFHEPGLPELLGRVVPRRLRAAGPEGMPPAVRAADVVVLAVPTPPGRDGGVNLTFLLRAAGEVGSVLRDHPRWRTIVVKSTCVPGTTDTAVKEALTQTAGATAGVDFGLAACPEFLSEGSAVSDFLEPDRLVFGADDPRSLADLARLHAGFDCETIIPTNTRTAEAIKYAGNAYLAACISFANELADVCEAVGGIDAAAVMQGVHASRYLTGRAETSGITSFLKPGCGYGGSCLPKDVQALVTLGRRLGLRMPLLSAVREVNDARAVNLVARLTRHTGSLAGRTVAVLGTAFKPGTTDLRDTPAEPIVARLLRAGAAVRTHDPMANDATRHRFGDAITVCDTAGAALDGAVAAVVCTGWPQYEHVAREAAAAGVGVVYDGRGIVAELPGVRVLRLGCTTRDESDPRTCVVA